MRMGRKRRINKGYDCSADCNPGSTRRWFKRRTVKLDRIEGQEEVEDQLEDYRFGVDPD